MQMVVGCHAQSPFECHGDSPPEVYDIKSEFVIMKKSCPLINGVA
jgi:hypothetical protein